MLHIPILRHGRPYRSVDVARAVHYRTREPFVEASQANPGLIRRDLLQQPQARQALAKHSTAELVDMCRRAAGHFANDALPLGDSTQTPQDYVKQVSATTGLPRVLAERNLQKIRAAMSQMPDVLRGLTRGLDLRILDEGYGELNGQPVSFYPRAQALGVVLPSNSPGVHSLWLPAIALKTPLMLKPGSAEPWTPYRIAQAMMRAGVPAEAFGYYPADHAGGAEILRNCGRGMVFGDVSSTRRWRGDARIEVHGPGYSKIVIGEDCIGQWEKYLDVMVSSIVDNGGRSCINASGVWAPARGKQIAEALADRLAQVQPRDEEDPEAQLAPFTDAATAQRISDIIDQGLAEEGARDVTAAARKMDRVAIYQGCSYLLPTVVHCDTAEHGMANREFLFPFASVVEVPQERIPEAMGPTLVVTAITSDPALIGCLLTSPLVDRLNLGAIATNHISWDQPHEGNLFEHLYSRRAFAMQSSR